MTAQPPAERPAPGYYPDPSIPGFVRYWDGEAWTPGSARPAPVDGAPLPPPPRAARGGVRVAPPPPPRPAVAEETGPVFLDETGAARLVVPSAPELPEFPRAQPAARLSPVVPERSERSDAPVWGASAQAQPGLLDTGSVPHHVSWGVPPASPAPVPLAGPDPDEELASALRLALSQTRRAQLPSPDRYEAEAQVAFHADSQPASTPAQRGTAATGVPTREADPVWAPPVAGGVGDAAQHADAWAPDGAAPREARGSAAAGVPTREADPAWAPPEVGGGAGGARRVEAWRPDGPSASEARGGAVAPPATGGGTVEDTGGWALPVSRPAARTVQPTRGDGESRSGQRFAPPAAAAAAVVPPTAPPQAAPAAAPRSAEPTRTAAPAAAPRAGRSASGVGQKRARTLRPALLGPRIGARLVDTVVTYALVGVLAVVLVQRVMLHLQAKIDAAQASGMPQTVWLVDGTVLANAGLLLVALLAVGLVYETIPLAVWGRTLGKAIFGLTVLDARSKARPRLARTFLRTAMCQTLVFLLLGILELVPCATDRKLRQSWHDKLGGTFVVKQGG